MLGHEELDWHLLDAPLVEELGRGRGEQHVARLVHDGTGDVDGVPGRGEAAGGAGRAVAEHQAAVELGLALERERRTAPGVEARRVLHHVDGGDHRLQGGLARLELGETGGQGALHRLVRLRPFLGGVLTVALARAAVDDEQDPVLPADLDHMWLVCHVGSPFLTPRGSRRHARPAPVPALRLRRPARACRMRRPDCRGSGRPAR